LIQDKVLLLVNDEDPLMRLFFRDWCEGDVTRVLSDTEDQGTLTDKGDADASPTGVSQVEVS